MQISEKANNEGKEGDDWIEIADFDALELRGGVEMRGHGGEKGKEQGEGMVREERREELRKKDKGEGRKKGGG